MMNVKYEMWIKIKDSHWIYVWMKFPIINVNNLTILVDFFCVLFSNVSQYFKKYWTMDSIIQWEKVFCTSNCIQKKYGLFDRNSWLMCFFAYIIIIIAYKRKRPHTERYFGSLNDWWWWRCAFFCRKSDSTSVGQTIKKTY